MVFVTVINESRHRTVPLIKTTSGSLFFQFLVRLKKKNRNGAMIAPRGYSINDKGQSRLSCSTHPGPRSQGQSISPPCDTDSFGGRFHRLSTPVLSKISTKVWGYPFFSSLCLHESMSLSIHKKLHKLHKFWKFRKFAYSNFSNFQSFHVVVLVISEISFSSICNFGNFQIAISEISEMSIFHF